jgi:hypothetical protein
MHLEKGQYVENCRGMTQARDGYISSRFNEENRTMLGIFIKHCIFLNMKITLKITFTCEKIFSSSTTTLEIFNQEHLNIIVY